MQWYIQMLSGQWSFGEGVSIDAVSIWFGDFKPPSMFAKIMQVLIPIEKSHWPVLSLD